MNLATPGELLPANKPHQLTFPFILTDMLRDSRYLPVLTTERSKRAIPTSRQWTCQ